ncbi:hypothetical protein O6P37_20330 [Mycobacterium sp. CPCC 205372]|uniref:DUF3592 domain-containing protein n=1 Tax=Mycobacterium hippophais TaxID=3016340 RepID=A0ABT4PXI3_9MYCO|nr:hypothetical protein [Mycobacterium hippophais]MCZ8381223.1 hypothetical protein [Mycobacterium hippophais]
MLEFGILLLMVGALALLIGPMIMRRRGMKGELAQGTLLVTGVSPRPDAPGEQFVTITGVINGPTVNEHVVYQRMAVDVEQWPTMGQLIPVVYSTKNPDKWGFGSDEAPPPPPPQTYS